METAHKERNKSPTRLTLPRELILEAENNHTNESRQRGEKEAYSTKGKAPCIEGVSQETQEVDKSSKLGDKQIFFLVEADKAESTKDTAVSASTQAPKVPAESTPTEGGEGVGEDQGDSINTDDVLVSTQALGPFDLGTPVFSQVCDPARSEIPSPNKDDTEENEGKNESMSTKKHSRKGSDDYLEKASNALTGMSVTAAAGSEKRYDVAAASPLKILKAGEERLITDEMSTNQKMMKKKN
jgi:hypothetical protein